jgi:hypothetical protein
MTDIKIYIEGENAIAFAEQFLSIEGISGRWHEDIEESKGLGEKVIITAAIVTIIQGTISIGKDIKQLYEDNKQGLERITIIQGDKRIGLRDSTSSEAIDEILSVSAEPISNNVPFISPISPLQEIAKLSIAERHKILSPFVKETAEDFTNDPELTEFSILDAEDWETSDN